MRNFIQENIKNHSAFKTFSYGSDNPVFGQTRNPFNLKLSPGGSNSGLGSLVGANGCMFGTGTDLGGSLRIPAHFNGVSAIMSTSGRLR
jgi:amidase